MDSFAATFSSIAAFLCYHETMKKKMSKVVKTLLMILAVVLSLLLAYVAYVWFSYYRVEDNLKLEIENMQRAEVPIDQDLRCATYNIGFGANGPEFSFFLAKGMMDDGTPVKGRNSKAFSKEYVIENTEGAISELKSLDPDIILIQEADLKSTRAYKVNQYEAFKLGFPNLSASYASDYDSAYLLYPIPDFHGKSQSGLVTLSRFGISEAVRRSYPVSDGFSKLFDLDRCFAYYRMPTENGKELVVVNSHMSAYDEGGIIRKAQWQMVSDFIVSESRKGNYVILGGDFNHVLGDYPEHTFPSRQETPEWVNYIRPEDIPEGFRIVQAENGYEIPSQRSTDIPWEKGVTHTCNIDGYIVSDNIEASSINIDTDFAYSDHQPVLMTFRLLP